MGPIGPIRPIRLMGPIRLIRLMGIIAITALLMVSCSLGQEQEQMAKEQEQIPIGFSTYTYQPQTRAMEVDKYIPQGLSIGVFSYYHNGTPEAPGSWSEASVPDFMFNQPCTSTEDGRYFAYSPLKYWPNYEHDRLSFIAYYPYTNSELAATTGITLLSDNTTPGLPQFEFINKDVDQQPDFIISELVRDVSKKSASLNGESGVLRVKFALKHALAKVEFRISVHPDIRQHFAQLRINNLSITKIKDKGELTITEDPSSSGNVLTWDPLSETGTTGEPSKRDFNIVDKGQGINDLKKVYLLMPQVLDDDAELVLDYELTLKGYNPHTNRYTLGFPNEEVYRGFANSLYKYYTPEYFGSRSQMNGVFQKPVVKFADELYIDVLVTSGEARRKGVGSALLNYAFALNGYNTFYVHVFSKNMPAIKLYEKNGFLVEKREKFSLMRFMGNGYPVKMRKTGN